MEQWSSRRQWRSRQPTTELSLEEMELKYGQWTKKRPTLIFYVNLIFIFIFLKVFCLCAVHAFLPVKRLLDKVFNKHLSPEQFYALQSRFFFLAKKECLLRSNNYHSFLSILVFVLFGLDSTHVKQVPPEPEQ